jgi:hypothetical protein
VVPTKKKTMVPLTESDIAGDGSVDDFIKWIENFATNDSGHFTDQGACKDFCRQVKKYIEVDGYIGKLPVV